MTKVRRVARQRYIPHHTLSSWRRPRGAFRPIRRACLSTLAAAAFIVPLSVFTPAAPAGVLAAAQADAALSLCGNQAGTGAATPAIQHVVVVMLENLRYNQVIGSPNAPYQTSLANQCGSAPTYFGATHSSAANYLALSGGQYPANSPPGCGSAKSCATTQDNLYHQLSSAPGMSWGGFMESMPSPCNPNSSGQNTAAHDLYSVGHNPPVFYTDIPSATCQANDVGVSDLTAQSGAFWDNLQNETLPSFSWVTPNAANGDEGPGTPAQNETVADNWLQRFVATVQQSNSYQSGNTLLLVNYDEGTGSDKVTGEDCTNTSRDLPVSNGVSYQQDSCHVPLFIVYPYTPAGASDDTFFDHYSITKTIEDTFGLPYLAHAGDAQTNSLVGHFGIPTPPTTSPASTVTISRPADNSTVSGTLTVAGTATDNSGDPHVQLSVDNGTAQEVTGAANWTTSIDTTSLSDGPHVITAQVVDAGGAVSATSSITVTVNNASRTTSCPALPSGTTELSGNPSLETDQTGWTGVYSRNSAVSRAAPTGGSYDATWALRIAPKAGTSGAAGVNNAKPIWVPGAPGTSTTSGQAYTASAFVQTSTPGEHISLLVRETTPSGTSVGSHAMSVTANDSGWHQISSSYTAKQTGDVLRYSLYASSLASSSRYFFADCISLQTPTSPTGTAA